MPAYVPFQGPPADLSATAQGVDPAYFKFPQNLVTSLATPPGDGGSVTATTFLTSAPPPPMEQNAAWQAINKSLNATLQMDQVPINDYAAKVNTVIAGSELPDFIYNPTGASPTGVIASLPQFLRTRCADLTPYLSGDGVKDYPNLAHFTTYSWRATTTDGKIYAIPIARPPIGAMIQFRADMFEKVGMPIDKAPKNADEFKRMLQAVTRPQDNQFGIAVTQSTVFGLTPGSAVLAIFRAPNNWRLTASGRLVKDFESDEFRAAVGFARDLGQLGVWHPNTPTYGSVAYDDFFSGRFGVNPNVWGGYVQAWDSVAARNPDASVYPMHHLRSMVAGRCTWVAPAILD